ncbi:MAG: 30S ribosomal protein S6, partial [Rhodospirillales bacterium]|nr:30S ribosomal protein S6 [Rhodospirillales bacterium]
VTKCENWGLRSLAYRIKKNRKGHYLMFNIDCPSGAVQEMERQMRLNEDVLRYLTIKVDKLDEEPSVQMQGRSGRDGQGSDDHKPYSGKPQSDADASVVADKAEKVQPAEEAKAKTAEAEEAESAEEEGAKAESEGEDK